MHPQSRTVFPLKLVFDFDITYTKTPGTARRIRPSTDDPLSPLNWAG